MQSPINIVTNTTTQNIKEVNFKTKYAFSSKIHFMVKYHCEEVIIDFLEPESNGFLELDIVENNSSTKIKFHPSGLYFRFRAEHTINDKRYDGELVFVFKEATNHNDMVNNIAY